MATLLTAASLRTPKRSSTIYEQEGNDDFSTTLAPPRSKRSRSSYPSASVSEVVEEADPFQSSQVPETQFESQILDSQVPEIPDLLHDHPPRFQITTMAKADETARVDDFIDHYEMSTKTPTKFTVVLRYLQEEHRHKLKELELDDDDYRGGGHRVHVTWLQYGKLSQLKLIMEVEAYPDNFLSVLERADKEVKGGTVS